MEAIRTQKTQRAHAAGQAIRAEDKRRMPKLWRRYTTLIFGALMMVWLLANNFQVTKEPTAGANDEGLALEDLAVVETVGDLTSAITGNIPGWLITLIFVVTLIGALFVGVGKLMSNKEARSFWNGTGWVLILLALLILIISILIIIMVT